MAGMLRMGRRLKIVVVVCVIAISMAGLSYWSVPSDPIIRGQPLSEHFKRCVGCGLTFGGSLASDEISYPDIESESRLAVEFDILAEVTPDAWPVLVRMLSGRESRSIEVLRWLTEKHKFFGTFVKPRTTAPFAQQVSAAMAFRHLGTNGAPAVGRIMGLLDDPESALAAMIALRHIQPHEKKHILQLTNVLGIRQGGNGISPQNLHRAAMLTLASFGTNAADAVPVLTSFLASTNQMVQATAAMALVKIGAPAEAIVPVVTLCLSQTNAPKPDFRVGVANFGRMLADYYEQNRRLQLNMWTLSRLGPDAAMALPSLSNLVVYPDREVQQVAKNAIDRIINPTMP